MAELGRQNLPMNRRDESRVQPKGGIPVLGLVFTEAAHMRQFIQFETRRQALYDHFLGESLGLDSRGGSGVAGGGGGGGVAIVEGICRA